MAKSKPARSMYQVGESQQVTEENHSYKFQQAKSLIDEVKKTPVAGRNFPQVSYTVSPEDKKEMVRLALAQSNKKGRIVSQSEVLRALIRLGVTREDELEIE